MELELESYKRLTSNLQGIDLIVQAAENALTRPDGTATGLSIADGRRQGNAMTNAGLVLLCGYFEGFVKDLAREYVNTLGKWKVTLANLPEPIYCAVVGDLAGKMRAEKKESVTNFKRTVLAEVPIRLDEEKFSQTGGNPSVDTIEKLFSVLGFPRIIDTLSIDHYKLNEDTFERKSKVESKMRDEIEGVIGQIEGADSSAVDEIIKLIDKKWPGNLQRRKVGYISAIEQLLTKRNQIAHGERSIQVTPTELSEHCLVIKKLSEGLHTVIVRTLGAQKPKEQAAAI